MPFIFDGIWKTKFDEKSTHLLNFTKTNGTTSFEVPDMMQKEEKLDYTTNTLFSSVKMPYGKGQYNMIVMLPAENKVS